MTEAKSFVIAAAGLAGAATAHKLREKGFSGFLPHTNPEIRAGTSYRLRIGRYVRTVCVPALRPGLVRWSHIVDYAAALPRNWGVRPKELLRAISAESPREHIFGVYFQ